MKVLSLDHKGIMEEAGKHDRLEYEYMDKDEDKEKGDKGSEE